MPEYALKLLIHTIVEKTYDAPEVKLEMLKQAT